jgi:hypothetical protein
MTPEKTQQEGRDQPAPRPNNVETPAQPEKQDGPGHAALQRAPANGPADGGTSTPPAARPSRNALSPARAAEMVTQPNSGPDAAGRARLSGALQRQVGNARLQRMVDPAMASSLDAATPPAANGAATQPALTITPAQNGAPKIQRISADEVIAQYTEPGLVYGTNLQVSGLAARLTALCRAGQYTLVMQVINTIDSSDRDDVSMIILGNLTILELIQIARKPDGQALLRTMRAEVAGGWETKEEAGKALLLDAVLGEEAARNLWNRRRIEEMKAKSPSDLESLAQLFEDDLIVDDGSVQSRLQVILQSTAHPIVPGLQTGIDFGDTGFRGEPTPEGSGFRDPHPSSANQVGHFLTAVGLQTDPSVVSRPIPFFGTVRSMVGAPAAMKDDEVALRLTIGHEKSPDPNGKWEILGSLLDVWIAESLKPGPDGETDEQRKERIGKAVADETGRQIEAIIAAFRAQFNATTDADIAAWNEALAALGPNTKLNTGAYEGKDSPLNKIAVNPAGRGNSRQDLRLSLIGWRLGQMIGKGEFASRSAVAYWIRVNLSATPPAPSPTGDYEPLAPPAGPGSAYG